MKKAAMITAILGGLLGFFGGLITIGCAGCGESIYQVDSTLKGKSTIQKYGAELGTKAGVIGIITSILGIVFGVVGGFTKSKGVSLTISILLIVTGIIAFIVIDYFSGPLLFFAGILGIISPMQIKKKTK